jgi:hypothetical protein
VRKKGMAIIAVMAMVLVGLVVMVNPIASCNGVPDIQKTWCCGNEYTEVWLGSTRLVNIMAVVPYAPMTVADHLPENLSYVSGTFKVDGSYKTPYVDGHVVSYTFYTPGTYSITFVVLCDSAPYKWTSPTEENIAYLIYDDPENPIDEDNAFVTQHSYCGFKKEADLVVGGPIIEINEDVQWAFHIEVKNIFADETLYNVVVTDRLGAELEVDDEPAAYATKGTFTAERKGNVKIEWTIGELAPGETVHLYMWISTRLKGKKQSYTSCGEYEWNSGATLKFNYGMGGVQYSAHTGQMVFYVPGPWPFDPPYIPEPE